MFEFINGINLFYEIAGEGVPLVFIHGLGDKGSSWRQQTNFFSKAFKTIEIDLRGHGNSEDGNEFITMELIAKDVITLLDHFDIEKAHFIGLSMGGLICQEIAKSYKERMLSMTLADAAGFYPEPIPTLGLKERLERIDAMTMEDLGAIIGKGVLKPNANPEIIEMITKIFQNNRKEPYKQATSSTLKADYRKYHKAMEGIPTLILVGELDTATPISYAQYLNQSIRGSKMQIIPEAAHASFLDNPQAFNRAVLEFLAPYELESAIKLL